MLTQEMLQSLKAELLNDPTGRGYSDAQTAEEKAALFNTPYELLIPMAQPARISQVLTQPAAPNVVSAQDITDALAE